MFNKHDISRGTVELYRAGGPIDRVRVESAGCEYGEYDE
jgi:hypothetical protein